jgi:hypothetical protein
MRTETGASLKKHGQQMALFNAGPGWTTEALQYMRGFCAMRREFKQTEFRFEEFTAWARQMGLSEPTSHHAWGALPRIMVREKLAVWTGAFEPAKSPKTHAHPVKVWRLA